MSDDLLHLIHDDVKEIKKDLSELKITSAKQQVSLDEHVKRSNSIEALVNHLDEGRIQPIEKELASFRGARKSFKWMVGTFIALGATVAAFLLIHH